MSDWDFLDDLSELGYSAEEISDALGSGVAPCEWEYIHPEWVDAELAQATDESDPLNNKKLFKSRDGYPYSTLEQISVFEDLVDCAARHFENTGRYLQIWGELGEIYAEIAFNLRRHATHHAGSDGTIDGKLVEVKTISPEKSGDQVLVRRQGEFEQLLIVRIDKDFTFKGKIFNRDQLKGLTGKYLRGSLNSDDR